MCCAMTVTAPCSPYLIPGYALLLLFLHQLWCSLAPTWALSVSQNQSTVLWRFRELNWLPEGQESLGRCRRGGGWVGRGRQRESKGQHQPWGSCKLPGQPGCWVPWAVPPKKTETPTLGQRVSLSGSSTEEHTCSCGWRGTQVSRRIFLFLCFL